MEEYSKNEEKEILKIMELKERRGEMWGKDVMVVIVDEVVGKKKKNIGGKIKMLSR
jgi:hypothetical protein